MSTASLNEVRLIGNLGADPELKYTPAGLAVATVSIATSYRRGETEKVEWHRVVFWQGTAERAAKFLRKGSSVWVGGRLQTRRWTDEANVERFITEVVGEQFQMLGTKRADSDDAGREGAPPKAAVPTPTDGDSIDDVPF